MILGTWSIVSYIMNLKEGKEVFYPYGENPIGFLIYTPKDVSVHIMRSNRSIKDTPLEKKIECAGNYGGYVGSYEIQGNTIIHYPKVCGFINFLQTPQIRKFELQDDLLILEYSFFNKEHGREAQSQLIWQRVSR